MVLIMYAITCTIYDDLYALRMTSRYQIIMYDITCTVYDDSYALHMTSRNQIFLSRIDKSKS